MRPHRTSAPSHRLHTLLTALLLCALLAASGTGLAARPAPLAGMQTSGLVIQGSTGAEHRFEVYEAADQASKAQGLMYVRRLPADQGMLFVFEPARMATMWMKDTYIPLDMLFVAEDGRIAHIHHWAQPLSLDLIRAQSPVRAVLELNGGTARRLGIAPGDRVLHRAFAREDG